MFCKVDGRKEEVVKIYGLIQENYRDLTIYLFDSTSEFRIRKTQRNV